MATPNSQSFNSFSISHSYFCLIFVKVDIVLVIMDLCKIMGVVVSALNNGKIGTRESCKLDFDLDLQREIQGKFHNHTLQPFVCFRSFPSYASPLCSKPFVVLLQLLSVLLRRGFRRYSTTLTMFSTILNLILFGFSRVLHCAFFCSISFML